MASPDIKHIPWGCFLQLVKVKQQTAKIKGLITHTGAKLVNLLHVKVHAKATRNELRISNNYLTLVAKFFCN